MMPSRTSVVGGLLVVGQGLLLSVPERTPGVEQVVAAIRTQYIACVCEEQREREGHPI